MKSQANAEFLQVSGKRRNFAFGKINYDTAMNVNEAESLLMQREIRPTANRILLVQALDALHAPVSQKQLEMHLMSVDKSVISRTLALMLQHSLVHAIPGPAGTELYELCRANPNDTTHNDEHAHFHCRRCGRTLCLHEVEAPRATLPQGFTAEHTHFVITGLCDRCAKRNS